MPNSPLQTHIQTLLAKAQTATARQHLLTLANSLPSAEEREQVTRLLEEPACWEEAVGVLDRALASLNPEQLKNYNLALGNDNISLQNIVGSVVNIHFVPKEKKSTYFLTLNHSLQDHLVIGRTEELQHLETLIQQAGPKPVVIWGPNGIGKTLLAELYWEKHKPNFDVVGWLKYDKSFSYTIVTNIRPQYADYVDFKEAHHNKIETYCKDYIIHELQNRPGRKLLVLDNVTADNDVANYLPLLNLPDLSLLITAHDSLGQYHTYAIPTLSAAEINELFLALSGYEADSATLELLGQLGQNALLTKLIARNVPHEDLREARDLILALKAALLEDTEEEHTPEQKVLWRLMQSGVADAAEQWVLIQFAAMPAMEISLEHFKNLVMPGWSQEDIFEAEGLKNYLEDHSATSEHSTMEEMILALVDKGWLEAAGEAYMLPEAIRACIELRFETYAAYFVELIDSLHLSYFGEEYGPVMGNALFVAHLKGVLPFMEYGEQYIIIHQLLIKTHQDLKNWNEEEKELILLLEEIKQFEGQWNERFWKTCYDLGYFYDRTDQNQKADQYSELQLEIAEKKFANQLISVQAQHLRGLVLSNLNKYNHAIELFKESMNGGIKILGSDHLDIAIIKSNLASAYSRIGDYENAIKFLEQAFNLELAHLGSEHPRNITNLRSLAETYYELGKYTQAVELLEQALENALQNYGLEHPTVAKCQSELALAYLALGDHNRAKHFLETALENNLKNFDTAHPQVGKNQFGLGLVYNNLGDNTQAIPLLEKALENALQNFTSQHPNVAKCQSELAIVYQSSGNYTRAKQLIEMALNSHLQNLGSKHPQVARDQTILAVSYYHEQRFEEAQQLLEEAKAIIMEKLEVNHPYFRSLDRWLKVVRKKLNP